MERRPLVAANLKMNDLPEGALEEDSPFRERGNADVIAIPTFLDIDKCIGKYIITGAQYGGRFDVAEGAYTGDISMQMLYDRRVRYVLCGHSERRELHNESNDNVIEQAVAVLKHNMHPIICVGENSEQRKTGKEKDVVSEQLAGFPFNSVSYTVAYEPIWAIGEKALRAATPEEAEEMHAYIRSLLDEEHRAVTRILYGGSVKPNDEAGKMIRQPNIDGFLVGGCSLQLDKFKGILDIVNEATGE
ncbi:triose-phosphate isomerase [Patescibacteria group bacterium]|nr:triose-phosphate isomerase [Patescibacteria group bacterium]MBU1123724.1 triose-phosphate isomerase [Patescibacteria group bacterium]